MKRIIAIALLLGSSFIASAQNVEMGLNGGVIPYFSTNNPPISTNGNGGVKHYVAVRTALNMRGWQIGLGVDNFQLGGISSTMIPANNQTHDSYAAGLFGNKLFRLPKSYIYAGINGGLNTGMVKNDGVMITPHNGYYFGLQTGYTLNIIKGFGLNAEVATRYTRVIYGDAGFYHVYLTFPISLGVRYTF